MYYLSQVTVAGWRHSKADVADHTTARAAWRHLAAQRRREERAKGKRASRTTWRLRLQILLGRPGRVEGPPAGLERHFVPALAHEVRQFGQ